MSARGFAGDGTKGKIFYPRLLMIVGLLLIISGWIARLAGKMGNYNVIIMTFVLLLVIGMLWSLGRQTPRSTYIQERWSFRDLPILAGAVLVISAFLVPLPFIDKTTLSYNPYPIISLPSFDYLIGISILGLLMPAVILVAQTRTINTPVIHSDAP
jgi:hypothetical protein